MKLLQRCNHALEAAHLANALRAAGIACEVRNTHLSGALGEIPWLECAPQLWLRDAGDETRARALLAEISAPIGAPIGAPDHAPNRAPDWTCPTCGETLEAQFGQCWHCGAVQPAPYSPA